MATALHLVAWLSAVVPHADSPLPSHVGLTAPFTGAGAGGVFAAFLFARRSADERDLWASRFSAGGFLGGATVYGSLLLYQLFSSV